MLSRNTLLLVAIFIGILIAHLFYVPRFITEQLSKESTTSGAGLALDEWTWERWYPNQKIPTEKLVEAFKNQKNKSVNRSSETPWRCIGPNNVGGRTLDLAFHPTAPEVIFAGSASGGLWKTTTAGKGKFAWEAIQTGFPVLGVSSIAIHPEHPDTMFIGTGEVYSVFNVTEPGEVARLTRGTYGIGVLKSIDGGQSWTKSLDWQVDDLKGIQDLEIDPNNPEIIYAATTDGLYKSMNIGESWELIHAIGMAVDITIKPDDSNTLLVSYGNLNFNANTIPSGIFLSKDGGASFTQVTSGLPAAYSGKATLAFSPSNPDVVYASIQAIFISPQQATTPLGLYKSIDSGETWTNVNNINVAMFQGWYSHDVAVHPENADKITYVGIDTWQSDDGGTNLAQKSTWQTWPFGLVPEDGPDGPPDYAHSDIHAVYYHPQNTNQIFLATDGGIYVSEDSGNSYESRNGGYITTQFYAQFANAVLDSTLVVAGAQDNASYQRIGISSWNRIIGGDGMSAAIDPNDTDIFYASAQALALFRTTDGGVNYTNISPPIGMNEFSAFNAPYALAPSDPEVIYAGGQNMYRSSDRGTTWQDQSLGPVDGGNIIKTIAVHPLDASQLYIGTASNPFGGTQSPKILKSVNEGRTWTTMRGLPNRVCKDIAFDPSNPDVIFVAFSGFGTAHVYQTIDGGNSWQPIGRGLPDLPTHAIIIDPLNTSDIYIGNDLGVYYSSNKGDSWEFWSDGLPEATLVVDLGISPINRKIRMATHGRGIWERPLASGIPTATKELSIKALNNWNIYPNPINDHSIVEIELNEKATVGVALVDNLGRIIFKLPIQKNLWGRHSISIGKYFEDLPAGSYFIQLNIANKKVSKQVLVL